MGMKNKILVILFIFTLLSLIFSGCTETKSPPEKNYINNE
jgi:ABC-type oligopeptide transport system substrate-binding subunit